MNTKPNLIYLAAGRDENGKERRLGMKLLASSILRSAPECEIEAMRTEDAEKPLFKIARKGLEEIVCLPDGGQPVPPWRCVDDLELDAREWLLYLAPGTLALRHVDHLLDGPADILWAPMEGRHARDPRTCGYLTEPEMLRGAQVAAPWSRPWHAGACSAVWAVRAARLSEVMAAWESIAAQEPLRDTTDRIQSAWNRLLMDTPLKVARLEKGEVHFPCLPESNYARWRHTCLISTAEWPTAVQDSFLQSIYYGTYFGDESGMYLEMVEP